MCRIKPSKRGKIHSKRAEGYTYSTNKSWYIIIILLNLCYLCFFIWILETPYAFGYTCEDWIYRLTERRSTSISYPLFGQHNTFRFSHMIVTTIFNVLDSVISLFGYTFTLQWGFDTGGSRNRMEGPTIVNEFDLNVTERQSVTISSNNEDNPIRKSYSIFPMTFVKWN